MKKIIRISLLAIVLLLGFTNISYAAPTDINLTIRDGGTIVFSGTVALSNPGTVYLNDNTGTPQSIDAQSVLSLLNNADILSSDFSISNLQYYSSFGSLYLKCITGTATGEKCDNWQYTVNNTYPGVGMDKDVLLGGENVYVYFGPQYKVSLSSNQITADDNLNVLAKEYDYQNNDWNIRTGVTVGLTQPDPNNPWSPTEVQTGAVDTNGQAIFSSIPVGSYNVGIQQDFYFPTEPLTVTNPPVPSSNGSILTVTPPKKVFDTQKAFSFLVSQQKEDGSFGEDVYTDWSGLTLTSSSLNTEKEKVKNYLLKQKFSSNLVTDYERRSIALMSLGINPYDVSGENYVKRITDSFDGIQFGDKNEDNDDIFALIVLQNAGFTQEEKIIKDDLSFIISKQKTDGSWDESEDMTGAGIESLSLFKNNIDVKNALEKAKYFLKQSQKDNGGWANVSSTSWVIEGILAIGENLEDWNKNGNTPIDYLAENQDTDGGIKEDNITNKIWETSYVLSSLSGKTWNQIMHKFEKPLVLVVVEAPVEVIKKSEDIKNKEIKVLETIKAIKITKKVETNKIAKADSVKTYSQNKKFEKLANIVAQNIAAPIAATDVVSIQKRGWFRRFFARIFGF